MRRFFIIIFGFIFFSAYEIARVFSIGFVSSLLIMAVFFIFMFGSLWLPRSVTDISTKRWFRFYSSAGTSALGFWGVLVLFFLLFEIVKLTWIGITLILPPALMPAFNVAEFHREAGFVIFSLAGLITVGGFVQVVLGPWVKRVEIKSPKIVKGLRGFTIAQISDLHIGPSIQENYVGKVVRRVNALKPDLIVVTGDLVDIDPSTASPALKILGGLRARCGKFYVTGNHEYYWGIEGVLKAIELADLCPLLNENQVIKIDEESIMVAGLTDPAAMQMHPAHRPDLVKATRSNFASSFKVLLSHQPYIYDEAERSGYDLQLSGHTHAGQFFPFSLFISLAHKYYRGLNQHGRLQIYVNVGTGYWGPANRFGVPAEITLMKLRGV